MPFFLANQLNPLNVVYLGGSITAGTGATVVEQGSWRALTRKWLAERPTIRALNAVNSGVGGTPSFYGLIRLQTDVLAYSPDVVLIDFAVNDQLEQYLIGSRTNGFMPSGEALIRRLWTALPNAQIIINIFYPPDGYSFMNPNKRACRDIWLAFAALYGLTPIRLDNAIQAIYPSYTDANVTTFFLSPGDVHPNDLGHALIATTLEAGPLLSLGGNKPAVLPTAYYGSDTDDFMHTPIIRNGTDNDGETGTWTTSGTARVSSVANSTISWTGTMSGFMTDDLKTGVIKWSVDGGAETTFDLSGGDSTYHAITNFARGVHTITLKVVSGTVTINRFLAV